MVWESTRSPARQITSEQGEGNALAEAALLLNQDRVFTKGMGGLFPERALARRIPELQTVLDLSCGAGYWSLEVAREYPAMTVIGVDHRRAVVERARDQARIKGLSNVRFEVMSEQDRLDFSADSFDFINARLLLAQLAPDERQRLVSECLRITRPRGVLRLTEGEWAASNSDAFERYGALCVRALQQAGHLRAPGGVVLGMTPLLRPLLQAGGYRRVRQRPWIVDYSADTPAFETMYDVLFVTLRLVQPVLVNMRVTTQTEVDDLYHQVFTDLRRNDFSCIGYFLTVFGEKPRAKET
jgi:ubiquinone/menaquinone biosynthesis C-methylase UbiE